MSRNILIENNILFASIGARSGLLILTFSQTVNIIFNQLQGQLLGMSGHCLAGKDFHTKIYLTHNSKFRIEYYYHTSCVVIYLEILDNIQR